MQERNLGKTPMGMLAIASAANNDVTAWCLLAAVIAVAKAGDAVGALYTIALTAVYILFMFCLARPFLRKIGELYNKRETVGKTLCGLDFPRADPFVLHYRGTRHPCVVRRFSGRSDHARQPEFPARDDRESRGCGRRAVPAAVFVFTGLRTEIGLLNTPHLWGVCALFIVMSIAGKLLGATLSARAVGESWKDSLSIGVLMNTRGLMELIVLNIGYEMGIIPGSLFVIFVIMALFTTFMATPLLSLIEKLFARESRAKRPTIHRYPRILISFANPESGPVFLKLVNLLYGRMIGGAKVTAVHYTIGTDTSPLNAYDYSKGSFAPLRAEADRLGLRIDTRYRVTDRYVEDLRSLAMREHYDFVLTGAGPSFIRNYLGPVRRTPLAGAEYRVGGLLRRRNWLFPEGLSPDKSRILFQSIPCTLGVFVNRGIGTVTRVGVMLGGPDDRMLLQYIRTAAERIEVELMSVDPELDLASEMTPSGRLTLCGPGTPLERCIEGKQLVVVSYDAWNHLIRYARPLLDALPSFVIVKPRQDAR